MRHGDFAPDHQEMQDARHTQRPEQSEEESRREDGSERQQRSRTDEQCLKQKMRWQQWVLPHVARLCLCEEIGSVDGGQHGERQAGQYQPALHRSISKNARQKMNCQHQRIRGDDESSFDEPATPLRARED